MWVSSLVSQPTRVEAGLQVLSDKQKPFTYFTGLNADVSFYKENPAEDTTKDGDIIQDAQVFSQLIQDYRAYKSSYWRNMKFNMSPTLGTCCAFSKIFQF